MHLQIPNIIGYVYYFNTVSFSYYFCKNNTSYAI